MSLAYTLMPRTGHLSVTRVVDRERVNGFWISSDIILEFELDLTQLYKIDL